MMFVRARRLAIRQSARGENRVKCVVTLIEGHLSNEDQAQYFKV